MVSSFPRKTYPSKGAVTWAPKHVTVQQNRPLSSICCRNSIFSLVALRLLMFMSLDNLMQTILVLVYEPLCMLSCNNVGISLLDEMYGTL